VGKAAEERRAVERRAVDEKAASTERVAVAASAPQLLPKLVLSPPLVV